MFLPWLIVATVVAMTGWFGASRVAARTWAALALGLFMLLAVGGACLMIGQSKTGYHLAGLTGAVLALLLFIAAAAVLLGAALRVFLEWRRPPEGARPTYSGGWGVLAIALFCGWAVYMSAAE